MVDIPDVNVLVALLWERHVHHGDAVGWFVRRDDRFATTVLTQAGFVRVSSHPRILGRPLAVIDAVATLARLCAHPDHRFVTDDHGLVGNPHVPLERLVGHRQVTDALLIATARAAGGRVVTFDRGCAELGGEAVRLLA